MCYILLYYIMYYLYSYYLLYHSSSHVDGQPSLEVMIAAMAYNCTQGNLRLNDPAYFCENL